jgi:tRNA U34 5-methylaminomethyl-2-thiouridine-forming methyltransferase MnmC
MHMQWHSSPGPMDEPSLITTSDGSHTLYRADLDETYHSRHGAVQESMHVFIQQGLDFLMGFAGKKQIAVLEIGFGTGLNALLTAEAAQHTGAEISYTSLEAFPIAESLWLKLNYAQGTTQQALFQSLHRAPWSAFAAVQPGFRLLKIDQTLQQVLLTPGTFDLIYFDAFAPAKQPEMWELPMLEKVTQAMANKSVFVTYCAKGQLKRDLRDLGLQVESLPGPPGKKEMVRAVKG